MRQLTARVNWQGMAFPSPKADRLYFVLFGAVLLLDGGIWAYLAARYQHLPAVLPIHYGSSGQVDRVGLRSQLFILPSIGLVVLVVNALICSALYRSDRRACYLLLSVSLLVELLVWTAAVRLIH